MTSPSPSRSEQLFHAALTRPRPEREPFVRTATAAEPELYTEVMELLGFHEAAIAQDDELRLEVSPVTPGGTGEESAAGAKRLDSPTGRYEILDVLGEGSMGIVYLAQQTAPVRRKVALKVIKLGIDSKRSAARFASERQALALMNHPSIARVFEAGTSDDGRLYFAMEYICGPPITEYCDGARLSLAARLELFVTVCNAAQHAHQKGVIHRDLKPSNVLVQVDGERPVPKIIDFGVAKATNQRLVEQTLYTLQGVMVGSLESMSPEQAGPHRHDIDTRTDVYALGVLLYQLATGAHPLRLDEAQPLSYAEIERRIRDMEPVRPSLRLRELGSRAEACAHARGASVATLERTLRRDVDWIVARALEKDRHRRYQSAAELGEDVSRYLRGEPVLAGPPGTRYRLDKFVRRNRALVTAALAVVAALSLGLVSTTWMYLRAREASRAAEAQRDATLAFSDRVWLDHCLQEAAELVPPHPEKIPAMETWLSGVSQRLAGRLPQHRQRLAELRSRASSIELAALDADSLVPGQIAGARFRFSDPELQFEHDNFTDLVTTLERFTDPDPHVGAIAMVTQRLEFAKHVEHLTIQAPRLAWEEAIASIADTAQCPAYGGLRIAPQMGLIPLGRDQDSGLWEFAHLQSGAPARRGGDGRLILAEETGMVLVLIPPGCFCMGAATDRADLPPGCDCLDPNAKPNEAPVKRICLDAFFLSKYEVTQAQWRREMGTNPSQCLTGTRAPRGDYLYTPLHPVERLNWSAANRVAVIWGATLPTEAQWEYAARAGTSWPWFTGSHFATLYGFANTADETARARASKDWTFAPWSDEFEESAPVGTFLANRFGLHDLIGNVAEWCADFECPYSDPPRAGDGLRSCEVAYRTCRGANWTGGASHLRISWRVSLPPTNVDQCGVRPAIPLRPSAG